MCAAATSPGVLQKLARVFKEKAQQDVDRIFKGTSKTREKLGVRNAAAPRLLHPAGRHTCLGALPWRWPTQRHT